MAAEKTNVAEIYRTSRERITDLVSGVDSLSERVPACPDWSVTDVIAHLSGLATDWRSGNLADYGSDAWTAVHIEDRCERDIDWILSEWADSAAAIAPALADPQSTGLRLFMPVVVITDLVSHEHDIRHALDLPGGRDSEAVRLALQSMIGGLRMALASADVPTLRIEAIGWRDWLVGRDSPQVSLSGDAFALLRTLTGRRTKDEARLLSWNGDPEPFLAHLVQPPFSWRETSLGE